MEKTNQTEFFTALGLSEEPFGMIYTNQEPQTGLSPKSRKPITGERKKEGGGNWSSIAKNFSCVLGIIWRARNKKTAAYFDRERFGCFGGAFYLGFLKRPPNFIASFVSTGIPNRLEGERYLESPEIARQFFQTIAPRPAPQYS